ncbi:hypothetical protein ACA910_003307 [Epithemia clementina (nom. ined.)]
MSSIPEESSQSTLRAAIHDDKGITALNNGEHNDVTACQEHALATPAIAPSADDAVLFSPQLLKMYYSRLFPFSLMHSWMSYGGKDSSVFSHREFSFTLDVNGEEIYLRYHSFSSAEDMQQAVLSRCPAKIDIGAVFTCSPSQKNLHGESSFQPVQREFVLDVDLTDYDEIRRCGCTGAMICGKCWTFMQMAVKVMDEGLRKDFGFNHVAWFYSGRRGVHAWVCDEAARFLTDEGRSAVASYFEVDLGSDRNKDVRLPYPLHPMLRRAFVLLEPLFIKYVLPASGHGLLAAAEQWERLLDCLPDEAEEVRDRLKNEWRNSKAAADSPENKWSDLKRHLAHFAGRKTGSSKAAKKALTPKLQVRLECWPYEVVFRYTYPRLDINVSKKCNHLLKSPFCVHPKTGRVCVPIQAQEIDAFDPFDVPTLPQLMRELDEYDRLHNQPDLDEINKSKVLNWEKTSLKSYFESFVRDFLDPMQREMRRKDRDALEEQAALVGDF